jgi:hypothetical protein
MPHAAKKPKRKQRGRHKTETKKNVCKMARLLETPLLTDAVLLRGLVEEQRRLGQEHGDWAYEEAKTLLGRGAVVAAKRAIANGDDDLLFRLIEAIRLCEEAVEKKRKRENALAATAMTGSVYREVMAMQRAMSSGASTGTTVEETLARMEQAARTPREPKR